MKNPFEFGRELDAEELVDRDDEVRSVVSAVMEAGKLFLIGPRRYGKTSILHVASERATRSGAMVFRYNAEAFPTLEQLAARIVTDTASELTPTLEKATHAFASFFSRVRPTASYDSVRHTWSVSFGRGPRTGRRAAGRAGPSGLTGRQQPTGETPVGPRKRRLRTASGLEMAPGAVDETAAIEGRVAGIDPARRRQPLPRRAGIRVSELVVAKVLTREGAVVALGPIMDWDVRHDLLLFDQPVQHGRRP